MATDDGFIGFNDATVGSFHTVDPPGFIPQILASVASIVDGNVFLFAIADADGHAGDPTMDKNVMFGFKAVHHGWDDCLDKRILLEGPTNFLRLGKHISSRETGQLRNSVNSAVEVVVALKVAVAVPVVKQIQGEIFVIATDQNHLIFLREIQDKFL